MFSRLHRVVMVAGMLLMLAGCPIDKANTVTQYATLECLFKGIYISFKIYPPFHCFENTGYLIIYRVILHVLIFRKT